MPIKPLNESRRYRKASREMAAWLAATAVSGSVAIGSLFGMAVGASGSIENALSSVGKPANSNMQVWSAPKDNGDGLALVAIFGTTLLASAAGAATTAYKASQASDRRRMIKMSLGYYD